MTCQNCVRHVTEALEELEGVESVDVKLDAQSATLVLQDGVAEAALTQAAAAALDDAGYTMGEVQTG